MQITERDVMELSALGRLALQSESITELQSQALPLLDRLIGSHVILFLMDPEQIEHSDSRLAFYGVENQFQRLFHTRFQQNPYADWARRMRTKWTRPVALPSAPKERVLSSPFYQEFMRPLGMYHMMAIGLVRDCHYVGLVGLCRPKHERDFSESDVTKAELLAPMLQVALERILTRERLTEMSWFADCLTEEGVAILDANLVIRYQNAVGREILGRLRGPAEWRGTDGPNELPAPLRAPCSAFAAKSDSVSEFSVDTARAGYSVGVRLRRLPADSPRPGFVLWLLPNTPTICGRDRLKKLGLTAREIDIVHAVGSGLTNNQIADKLCISFFTVQSHLKSIYQKLDVQNRAALLSVVARATRGSLLAVD